MNDRTYFAAAGKEYAIESDNLTPHSFASVVHVPGADGVQVFSLEGVDSGKILVIPGTATAETRYWLLIREDVFRSAANQADFGVTGLCRYRANVPAGCT